MGNTRNGWSNNYFGYRRHGICRNVSYDLAVSMFAVCASMRLEKY